MVGFWRRHCYSYRPVCSPANQSSCEVMSNVCRYVRLTSERQSQQGWIFSRVPLTATNWEVHPPHPSSRDHKHLTWDRLNSSSRSTDQVTSTATDLRFGSPRTVLHPVPYSDLQIGLKVWAFSSTPTRTTVLVLRSRTSWP